MAEFEQQGYKFRLDGEQVMVRGPRLSDPVTVERLRRKKPSILREMKLRQFIDLVRVTAAREHDRLLHRRDIEHELDADDVADLLNTTREERQAWASAIAHRLTRPGPGWEDAAC